MMRLYLLIIIFLAACGNSAHASDEISTADYESRYGYINDLRAEIEHNKTLVESITQELARIQFENQRLEALIGDYRRDRLFPHGLNEGQVREYFADFFDNSGIANELEEKLGMTFSSDDFAEIYMTGVYILARVADWTGMHFFFYYEVINHDDVREVEFTLIGYDVYWLNLHGFSGAPRFTLFHRDQPKPRRLTNLPYVTVRFYYFPDSPPYDDVTAHYIEETIRGADLWQETIRLSAEHNGILIRDLWYDSNTLYVDLKLAMNFQFRIGLGSILWAESMIETFYSFPNVSNVVFLLDGKEMPGIYNGWCVNTRTFPWWEGE